MYFVRPLKEMAMNYNSSPLAEANGQLIVKTGL